MASNRQQGIFHKAERDESTEVYVGAVRGCRNSGGAEAEGACWAWGGGPANQSLLGLVCPVCPLCCRPQGDSGDF